MQKMTMHRPSMKYEISLLKLKTNFPTAFKL